MFTLAGSVYSVVKTPRFESGLTDPSPDDLMLHSGTVTQMIDTMSVIQVETQTTSTLSTLLFSVSKTPAKTNLPAMSAPSKASSRHPSTTEESTTIG
jgi:hypothetical protein